MKVTRWMLFALSAILTGWLWPKSDQVSRASLKSAPSRLAPQNLPSLLGSKNASRGNPAEALPGRSFEVRALELSIDHEFAMHFQRWAEVDPEGMIAWVSENRDSLQNHRQQQAWSAWARADFEGVLSYLEDTGPDNWKPYYAIATSAGLEHPEQVAHWFESLPEGRFSVSLLQHMLPAWGATNPEAALAFAQRIDAPSGNPDAQERVLRGMAGDQPEQALAYAHDHPKSFILLYNVLRGAATKHPEWVQSHLNLIEDYQRHGLLGDALNSMSTRGNFEAAWEFTHSLSGESQAYARANLLFEFEKRYPDAVIDELELILQHKVDADVGAHEIPLSDIAQFHLKNLAVSDRSRALDMALSSGNGWHLESVIDVWAENDVSAATTWLNEQDNQTNLQKDFWNSHLSQNQDQIYELATTLPPGPLQHKCALKVVEKIIDTRSEESSLDWARDAGSTQLESRVWEQLFLKDPDQALGMIQDTEPDHLAPALRGIVSGLIENNDFAQGAALVDANFDPDVNFGAIALAKEWRKADPESAIIWIDSLPEGKVRNQVVKGLVKALGDSSGATYHPPTALKWMMTIPLDRDLYFNHSRKSFHAWMLADEPEARAFLEDPHLPEELRKALQNP